MNSVTLIGRPTKDPVIKQINSSKSDKMANFTLAVDRPAARVKTTDFIFISVFGKLADVCDRYLTKGRLIGVSGWIYTKKYTVDGKTRFFTSVVARRIEFCGKRTGVKETQIAEEVEAANTAQAAMDPSLDLALLDEIIGVEFFSQCLSFFPEEDFS